MSTTQEAPALIQYACERCKTRFVLPPSSRKLNLAGKVRAFSMGVGRTFQHHEGLGAGYDAARRQLLAKMDDEAYQSFVQSFRFCHECRQFVCNECWSTSRRSCLTCVAKSMTGTVRPRPPFAPTGPEIPRPAVASAPVRKGRLRRDIALVALAVAIVLLSIEGGVLLVEATSGPNVPAEKTIYVSVATDTASTAPTASKAPGKTSSATQPVGPKATPTPTPHATPTPTAAPTPTPTAVATPTATATATPRPTRTPRPTAKPTPKPTPVPAPVRPTIVCSATNGGANPYTLTCSIANASSFGSSDKKVWFFDLSATSKTGTSATWTNLTGSHEVWVQVTRTGYPFVQSGDHSGPPYSNKTY